MGGRRVDSRLKGEDDGKGVLPYDFVTVRFQSSQQPR